LGRRNPQKFFASGFKIDLAIQIGFIGVSKNAGKTQTFEQKGGVLIVYLYKKLTVLIFYCLILS